MAFTLRGEVWPTKVQREVAPRVVAKWAKSLELCGPPARVLYHEEARRKQQTMVLFEARYKLPAAESCSATSRRWKPVAGHGRQSRRRGEGVESPVGACRSNVSHVHKTTGLDTLDRQGFTVIRGQVLTIDC